MAGQGRGMGGRANGTPTRSKEGQILHWKLFMGGGLESDERSAALGASAAGGGWNPAGGEGKEAR